MNTVSRDEEEIEFWANIFHLVCRVEREEPGNQSGYQLLMADATTISGFDRWANEAVSDFPLYWPISLVCMHF